LHGGFRHITQLHYFCHDLHNIPSPAAAAGLLFEAYAPANASAFQETLLRTYEDTLDCPELNGLRTIDEILVGHQAQGIWRPETWWLVFADGVPAGILMLTELFERDGWELTYVGIAKEHRSRGLGRKLIVRALREMHEREAPRLVVAVDRRNTPALRLYEGLGFAQTGSREVFLCTIGRPGVYARDVKDA
jgi:ribosomal protein S18 acetylase RimI-like enzyme